MFSENGKSSPNWPAYAKERAVLIPSEPSRETPWSEVVWAADTMPPTPNPAEIVNWGWIGMVKRKLASIGIW